MKPSTSLRGEAQALIDMRAHLDELDKRLAKHEAHVRRQLEAAGIVGDWCDERLAEYRGSE